MKKPPRLPAAAALICFQSCFASKVSACGRSSAALPPENAAMVTSPSQLICGFCERYSSSTQWKLLPPNPNELTAARRAFPEWALTPPAARAEVLRQIADGIRKRREELVEVIIGELGAPRPMTSQFMVDFPANTLQFYADLLATYSFEERIGNSLVIKEPAGVVAAITPWNYPLHQIVAKLGPALAAGCTVVLKPSEVVPLSCFMLAEIVNRTSIPKGVFNFLSGAGPVVGEAMGCGTPVVGSDLGGIREMVLPGKTGWLLPPGDTLALKSALTEVLSKPNQLFAMRRDARQMAEKRVSPAVVASQLRSCFLPAAVS